MRLASFSIVKLLKPRLGSPAVVTAPEIVDRSQISLLQLADELESALQTAPPRQRAKATRELKELAALLGARLPQDRKPEVPPINVPQPCETLEGRKVAAIGFGRQDISRLAAAMIEHRARIEFLSRGHGSELNEFDLILLNASSTETLKREAVRFREVLAMGIPAIVVGSRAAINLLRDDSHLRTWDFVAKPLHTDELFWRVANLLSRQEEAACPRARTAP